MRMLTQTGVALGSRSRGAVARFQRGARSTMSCTIPSQSFVELHPSASGYYTKARIEGAPDRLSCTFVGVLASRNEAISGATSWALGWLRRLRERRRAFGWTRCLGTQRG